MNRDKEKIRAIIFGILCIFAFGSDPSFAHTKPQENSYQVVNVTTVGSIEGRVTFEGEVSKPPMLPVSKDTQVCGKVVTPEQLIIGSESGVANAVIFLEDIRRGREPAESEILLDQKACVYKPHVQATTIGSTLVLKNSDPVLHSVHGTYGGIHGGATAINVATPKNATIRKKLSKPGLIGFMCHVGHDWMGAYLFIFAHPYFAVTESDGRFQLKDVPAGTYTLKVWHEGWKIAHRSAEMIHFEDPKALTQKIEVTADQVTKVDFVFRN